MRVLVTGSFLFLNIDAIRRELSKLPTGTTIVVGNLPGAEVAVAKIAAEDLNMEIEVWETKEDCHDSDLFIRNSQMIDSEIDMCIAFESDRSPHTDDCVKRARSLHIETIIVK